MSLKFQCRFALIGMIFGWLLLVWRLFTGDGSAPGALGILVEALFFTAGWLLTRHRLKARL